MPLYALDEGLWFPPVSEAMQDGLLAIGGDLSIKRLMLAYKKGIFPWYDGTIPLWWCPNPRFVLFPSEIKVSKSMKRLLKKNIFRFTVNTAFEKVIHNCKTVNRINQDGTWINKNIENAYTALHHQGIAHSAESWLGEELAGGVYGLRLGNFFFGESMFSLVSNASKFAFISYVKQLEEEGVKLIDCQVYSTHLESLGARMRERTEFIKLLNELK